MIEHQLHRQVDRVAARLFWERLCWCLSLVWFASAAVVCGVLLADIPVDRMFRVVLLAAPGAAVVATFTFLLYHRSSGCRLAVARRIEAAYPELNQRLLAALEQQPSLQTSRYSFLQRQVMSQALGHSRLHDWTGVLPSRRLMLAFCLHNVGLGLFATAASVLLVWPTPAASLMATSAQPQATANVAVNFDVTVEPGNTEVERGMPLLVLARFGDKVPADAVLVLEDKQQPVQHLPMTKSLDDPLFAARIPTVDGPLTYRVAYDGRQSEPFAVTVFEFPKLQRADATVSFPDYTGLEQTLIEDVRRLSVVEGATVSLKLHTNKPISTAKLLLEDETAIACEASSDNADVFHVKLQPQQKTVYRLELVDAEGRRNKFPPEFEIDVVPNRRPELKLAFPSRDLRVSPLEEISLEATAADDFGLQEHGLIFAVAGEESQTVVLGEAAPAREPQQLVHQLSLEQLAAEPDELVSYYFFADDVGPDGQLRRTFSDMFFAEVRHFEEIFREVQAPPGGGSQMQGGGPQSQAIDQLTQLQKQIVNATWSLIRRETGAEPSKKFGDDVDLISESQQSAVEKVRELDAKLNDPQSKIFVAAAEGHMRDAVRLLTESGEQQQPASLSEALSVEQAAYQALLKLRAREHRVAQNQSGGGGGGGGGGRSQQQLNQLELSNQDNRYEAQKQAGGQEQQPANREQLQVLNRLRELARRQEGLNEKLKELEAELRLAQTEQEREEIRRRLKRLRDEQQQMLRDLDEVRQRMDGQQNQQRMAESRQQLDQTRDRVRQASEALKDGQVSKALNAGTRAQRELEHLRDDFRNKTAGQFGDAMRQMRDEARELSQRQDELADQLQQHEQEGRKSLRYARDREEIQQGLNEQKQKLENLFDNMRDVVEQAEPNEPLLSKQLYDTLRESRTSQPEENLEAASKMVGRGLLPQASEAEQTAHRGIDKVAKGIEQAAESVLGNELEGLKRAKQELDELGKSLRNEIAESEGQQNDGNGKSPSPQPRQTAELPNKSGGQPNQRGSQDPSRPNENGQPQQQPGGQNTEGEPQTASSESPPSSEGSNSSGKPSQQQSSSSKPGLRGGKGSPQQPSPSQSSSLAEGGSSGGPGGPLTGSNFQEWSDRLRDVEEMVEDPKLRSDAARIRDRARSVRAEFKRHSKEPNWDLVRESILEPMLELEQRLAEEVARRESPEKLVPIDRDPVPKRFAEMVRKYYEDLGRERK